MPYFEPGDPSPRKTLAELEAEETPRDKLDDANDAHPVIRWSAFVVAVLMIAGGIIRWCVAP